MVEELREMVGWGGGGGRRGCGSVLLKTMRGFV